MLKAVLFDWGNTVMEELSDQTGIMANWKKVAATPGIESALKSVINGTKLCIATNAAESNSEQVRKALDRVGLATYFDNIFTSSELQSAKPQKDYFEHIAEVLEARFSELLMVGDSYSADAQGPAVLGLRAIWYRRNDTLFAHHHPFYDGEITTLDDFPKSWEHIHHGHIPTILQSMRLMREYGMPNKVLRHTQVVAMVGYVLARWLVDAGIEVDPIVVHRAGLLHDLDKAVWKQTSMKHGEASAEFIRAAGFHPLVSAIKRHQIFNILDADLAPQSWVDKLVYLADKYSEKDQIVPVEARVGHLSGRYPDSAQLLQSCLAPIHRLEQDICKILLIEPHRLLENVTRVVSQVDLTELHLD